MGFVRWVLFVLCSFFDERIEVSVFVVYVEVIRSVREASVRISVVCFRILIR